MLTVAHCATPFLPTTTPWLYRQIALLKRYRPLVLTQERQNEAVYPVEALYCAENGGTVRQLANRLVRKATGEYPFYAEVLRREGAALIHAHFGDHACRCLRAKQATGLPMIAAFYGADATQVPRDPAWARRYERLFGAVELFLVEGGAMVQNLVDLGCPPEKIRLHRLGVEVERITYVERLAAAEVRFLICGSFREKKGIPYALEAIARAAEQRNFPYSITLIGDGPERAKILEVIGRTGLEERVELVGWRPYEQVLAQLPNFHILLQTSVTAADGDSEGGAPVILLDAQASGMPVVGSYHGDIPEYIAEGESGLLAPERDVERLADCILNLVDRPEQWADLGRAGRRHVEKHYSARVQVALLEQIYDELV